MKRLYILAGANGSGKSTIAKIVDRAKSLGYTVVLLYIYVDSPEVCFRRIETRVQSGGHAVPSTDVARRYTRSMHNFANLYRGIVDCWLLYYNGGTDFSLVAYGNGDVNVISKERYESFMEGVCRK